MGKYTPNQADFVASNENAKSQTVGQFVWIARKAGLDYANFLYVCQQARKKLGLKTPKKERKLPQLLSEAALQRFFRVIQDCGDVQHEIMLKFLFYTAVRVSELVGIRVENVDLEQCKVFIGQGKGAKDRYILFPSSFRLVLKSPCSDPHDIEHMVEVSAQSVYEAVAQTLRVFRDQEWCEDLRNSVASVLARIRQPEVEHRVCIRDFERWLETAGRSPAEMA